MSLEVRRARGRRSRIVLLAAGIAVCAASATARSATLQLRGDIVDARNLTFAVLDGEFVSNPQPSDLPLEYDATLVIDDVSGEVGFDFSVSFSEPGRAYSADRSFTGLGIGLAENSAEAIRIEDQFAGFDFVLDLDLDANTGSWNLFEPNPVNSDGDLFVSANVDSVAPIPLPAAAWLFVSALLGLGAFARRRAP